MWSAPNKCLTPTSLHFHKLFKLPASVQCPLSSLKEDSEAIEVLDLNLLFWFLRLWNFPVSFWYRLQTRGSLQWDICCFIYEVLLFFHFQYRERRCGIISATEHHLLVFLRLLFTYANISYFSHYVSSSEKQCNDLHNELNFLSYAQRGWLSLSSMALSCIKQTAAHGSLYKNPGALS